MIVIMGKSGNLGSALFSHFGHSAFGVGHSFFKDWWKVNEKKEIEKFLAGFRSPNNSILIASGLLDPKYTDEEMLRANFFLPKNVIEVARELNWRVVTFGTISETFQGHVSPYLRSKQALGEYLLSSTTVGDVATHVRLHTLYGGGRPKPYMFLGQILNSLLSREPLKMTQGKQLREYHDVNDDALAIDHILNSGRKGVIDLSHGQPITLRKLAEHVFLRFDSSELLSVGLLPEPIAENYDRIFQKEAPYLDVEFRTSLEAIGDYLELIMKKGFESKDESQTKF